MKTIVLASAALANDGGYRDAGSKMTVGKKPGEIDAERAKVLLDRGFALTAAAAASAEKVAPEPAAA